MEIFLKLRVIPDDFLALPYIISFKQKGVYQKRVELAKRNPFFPAAFQGIMVLVSLIGFRAKTAKKAGHREVHFPVAVINGGIIDPNVSPGTQAGVPRPKVPVEETGRLLGEKRADPEEEAFGLM